VTTRREDVEGTLKFPSAVSASTRKFGRGNIPLLRWFALACTITAGLVVGISAGGLRFLWGADATHITLGMLLLFVIVTLFIGRLTAIRPKALANTHATYNTASLTRVVDACWFAAELEMGLGILVTVSGFLIAFSHGFAQLNLADTDAARALVAQMASGLSTALVGTLVGIASSMLLKLQLVNLETYKDV
jgi:hypothetical protein